MENGIYKLLNDVFDTTGEKLDLTNDEDYAKFNDYVDKCKKVCDEDEPENNLTRLLWDMMFGFDMKDIIDDIKKAGDEIHAKAVKEREKKEEKKVPELPSKKTPLDKQAHLHKIVGEYVDTYIRPYGNMETKIVDDVYAGLFEFACWVMNR